MSRETAKRPQRTPIGTRNVLTVQGKEPGYVYRIVNDSGDRVEQFKGLGYEIVTDNKVKVGDRRIANPTQEGSPVQVSVGGGLKGYLMRIPQEYYDDDQKAKQSHVNELESTLKQEARQNSDYGKLDLKRN